MAVTEREAVEYALGVRARLLDQLRRPEEAAEVRDRVPRESPGPPDSHVVQLEKQLAESKTRISQLASQLAALEAKQGRVDRKSRGSAVGRKTAVTSYFSGRSKSSKNDEGRIIFRKKA